MLILMSYSKTQHELDEIWTGTLNTELSPVGVGEAKDFAHWDGADVDRAFVAPAAHIQEFAKIVLVRGEYEVVSELADRSMGNLTGRGYRETMVDFPRRNWLAWHRSYWSSPPEGESFFDITDRVLTALRTKILPIESAHRVAIVAAPDVLRILIGYLTKTDEADVPKIRIEPCVPHVINGDIS
jgi:broad specificity phosphatase PhoE